MGVVNSWTSYREFWFEDNSAEIRQSDEFKLGEIAMYMSKNPSLQIGIDAVGDGRNGDAQDVDLCNRRMDSIRSALVNAGVNAGSISFGAYGNPDMQRDRRVEVLIASAN